MQSGSLRRLAFWLRLAGHRLGLDFFNPLREVIDRATVFEKRREVARSVHVAESTQHRVEEVNELCGDEIERPTHFKSNEGRSGQPAPHDFSTDAIDKHGLLRCRFRWPRLFDGEGVLQYFPEV